MRYNLVRLLAPKLSPKQKSNGFAALAWWSLFVAVGVILGVVTWITFFVSADKETHFVPLIGLWIFLIYAIVAHWFSIGNFKGFPVFKALRRVKNPSAKSPKNTENSPIKTDQGDLADA